MRRAESSTSLAEGVPQGRELGGKRHSVRKRWVWDFRRRRGHEFPGWKNRDYVNLFNAIAEAAKEREALANVDYDFRGEKILLNMKFPDRYRSPSPPACTEHDWSTVGSHPVPASSYERFHQGLEKGVFRLILGCSRCDELSYGATVEEEPAGIQGLDRICDFFVICSEERTPIGGARKR
jgi:hypothetical protein